LPTHHLYEGILVKERESREKSERDRFRGEKGKKKTITQRRKGHGESDNASGGEGQVTQRQGETFGGGEALKGRGDSPQRKRGRGTLADYEKEEKSQGWRANKK